MTDVTERVEVAAPPEVTWEALVDWERQGEWMLGTRVRVTGGDGKGVGSSLSAFTGVLGLGFTDTMRITTWQAPHRVEVEHTGRVVRGTGLFEVQPRGTDASTFIWHERLDLPLGKLGQWGWTLAGPAFRLGVRHSLTRFARFAESRR
ncbi:SRPBCC family protein [Actinokineospora bangkokensis]|uniref:Polyketide cyclase n=1 Tax=Actinokineospora bangkokensis TaxID=1193682 RepID=A0A1Q9LDM4_9PSEU|nr:SRPBCC family protein [Actinokineospora bangkokensis]OLR90105.1 polyketide cyclase [Actinokineospora bangkokensis]